MNIELKDIISWSVTILVTIMTIYFGSKNRELKNKVEKLENIKQVVNNNVQIILAHKNSLPNETKTPFEAIVEATGVNSY